MQFNIKNFRGISDAEIQVDGVTGIFGKNFQGKTSLSQAICAVVTGNPLPAIDGLTKAKAGVLIHSGTASAWASIKGSADTGDFEGMISWPECTPQSKGTLPRMSDYASGHVRLSELDHKSRTKALLDILQALPTEADLAVALTESKLDTIISAKAIMEKINVAGWDTAYDNAKEKGTQLKGRWEQATGDRYGSKKASSWLPKDWEMDLEKATKESIAKEIAEAKEWLEAAIAANAVEDAEVQRLTKMKDSLPGLREKRADREDELASISKDLDGLQKRLSATPMPREQSTQVCPHCKKTLAVVDGKIVEASLLTKEAKQKAINDRKELEAGIASLQDTVNKYRSEIGALAAAICDAEGAENKLANIASTKPAEKRSAEDCRARLARAEARGKAVESKSVADSLSRSIEQNKTLQDILAPTGLRQQKLQTALDALNTMLSKVCEAGKWKPVTVKPEYVMYGTLPYGLCSESEQLRADITLQIAIAHLDKSELIVVDRTDRLDREGRNGLFRVLKNLDIPSVVCMTLLDVKDVPNLKPIGGRSYWVEAGVAIER